MVTDAEILESLVNLEEDIRHDPTQKEYDDLGRFSSSLIGNRFGSFTEAKRMAGVDVEQRHGVRLTKERIIEDLQSVADELGYTPTEAEYNEHGNITANGIRRHFDSFVEAREAAGLDTIQNPRAWKTEEQCLADLQRVYDSIGHEPGHDEYDKYGRVTRATLINKFGSFKEAKKEAGIYEDRYEPLEVDKRSVLLDIKGLYMYLGHVPSGPEQREHGKYSEMPAVRYFGTYSDAREAAGIPKYKDIHGENHPMWDGGPPHANPSYTGRTWHTNKERARRRDGYTCRHPSCEIDRQESIERWNCRLHIHHLTRDHWPDEPEKHHELSNMVSLCNIHHPIWEGRSYQPAFEYADPMAGLFA